jgi:hypothetical protein
MFKLQKLHSLKLAKTLTTWHYLSWPWFKIYYHCRPFKGFKCKVGSQLSNMPSYFNNSCSNDWLLLRRLLEGCQHG